MAECLGSWRYILSISLCQDVKEEEEERKARSINVYSFLFICCFFYRG